MRFPVKLRFFVKSDFTNFLHIFADFRTLCPHTKAAIQCPNDPESQQITSQLIILLLAEAATTDSIELIYEFPFIYF